MPDIIQNNHVYIAQPPPYKVSQKKHDQYMIDDEGTTRHLAYGAIENTQLFLAPDTPPVSRVQMEKFCQMYWDVSSVMSRAAHYYPQPFIDALLLVPAFPNRKKI